MKTIGLIGGMSWESSVEYYRIINEAVRDRLGGVHSGKSLMLADAYADIRFNPDIDRQSGFRTRSMVAAPLPSSRPTNA